MKVLLVNPPNGLNDRAYLAPPLGLLTIAAFIKQFGYETDILDLNLELFENNALDDEYFYENALGLIAEKDFDVIGFTSMCLESHVGLEIAKRLKIENHGVVTVFGGTHFGAVANEMLSLFPFADFVISGEGEHGFLAILNHLAQISEQLPRNVHYRRNGIISTGNIEPQIFEMDELPFPSYELIDLNRYFDLNPSNLFNYEAGRGCVFKCEFCYSPFHYGDAFRHKSAPKIVEELKRLNSLGAKHIFFVQDNFLNSPRWANETCRQIAEARLPLTWECYATYPQLKETVINSLSAAGCIGVFTGIDAVAPSSQKRMNKLFLRNWKTASQKLQYCLSKKIKPICAFILEEPEQGVEKFEDTIYTALECLKLGCEVHLNTLSIYNQTGLARKAEQLDYFYSSIKAELLLDTPKVLRKNDFATTHPELFPYHSTYCEINSWEIFTAKAFTILAVIVGLKDTLYKYAVIERQSVWSNLEFIDSDFVNWLRDLTVEHRNEAVLLEFAKRFALLELSDETRFTMHVELTRLILSKRKTGRFINLFIEGVEISAELFWSVNLQKLTLPSLFSGEKILRLARRTRSVPEIGFRLSSNETVMAVLLDDKIRLRSVPKDLELLLANFAKASASGKKINLTQSEFLSLKRDGWISVKMNQRAKDKMAV